MDSEETVKKELNLEEAIKEVISKKMGEGFIEELVAKEFEKGIQNAMRGLFESYGDVTKAIESKIKSVMVPFVENYDYSEYLVKLDTILTEVLKNTAVDNKKILQNFKTLTEIETRKTIKLSELFEEWKKYVAHNVETSGLDVEFDCGEPAYEPVEITVEVDYENDRGWGSFEYANVVFECEHDENMNFMLRISRWKNDKKKMWDLHYDGAYDFKSLRFLNDFQLLLMQLDRAGVDLEVDMDSDSDEITPEAEPEAIFS